MKQIFTLIAVLAAFAVNAKAEDVTLGSYEVDLSDGTSSQQSQVQVLTADELSEAEGATSFTITLTDATTEQAYWWMCVSDGSSWLFDLSYDSDAGAYTATTTTASHISKILSGGLYLYGTLAGTLTVTYSTDEVEAEVIEAAYTLDELAAGVSITLSSATPTLLLTSEQVATLLTYSAVTIKFEFSSATTQSSDWVTLCSDASWSDQTATGVYSAASCTTYEEDITTTLSSYTSTGVYIAGSTSTTTVTISGSTSSSSEEDSPATGVESIEVGESESGDWYNIVGQKVSEPSAPGIYIRNGKKYLIR